MRPAQLLLHGIDGETKAERGEVSYPTGMKLGGKADLSFSIDFRLSITHETVRIYPRVACGIRKGGNAAGLWGRTVCRL